MAMGKNLIVYYSFSGNTDKVAKIFSEALNKKGETELKRLRPKDEITNFIGQCRAARGHKRAVLDEATGFDVSHYDVVVLGCPVWAFAPVPAMNTYLDKVSGISGKKVIVLLTSGSGLGVKMCFNNIRKALAGKGVTDIAEINIPDRKQSDQDFIKASLEKVL
jgi:flavodoxin